VREAFLKTEDSSVLKVAVKVLRGESSSSSSSSVVETSETERPVAKDT